MAAKQSLLRNVLMGIKEKEQIAKSKTTSFKSILEVK